jgi:mono/diheme cytochrome c family protein
MSDITMTRRVAFGGVFLLLSGALLCRIATAAAPKAVDYRRDIQPLLKARCYACHGNGSQLGGLQLDRRDGLLTGGKTGLAVVVGQSDRSLMIRLVSGAEPGRVMPARGARLTKAEIDRLRAWIDPGLPFDGAGGGTTWRPSLAPRRPALPKLPPGSNVTHPIDRLLQPYYKTHRIALRPVVDDRTYARRLSFDLIGLPPSPADLAAFQVDRRPDKRARLARRLLSDNARYATHWLSFWNDVLRNDYTGTGYIDGGRSQITGWLYHALATNMPYDRFVTELVNPTPESAGFAKGIVWRGVVNASQTPEMQAAQNVSQIFMGANLKCASCHDSFINTWKLADAYGMAGIFADRPLEMVRCDRPMGQVAPLRFLYPELGKIDPDAPRAKRLEQLAAILTSKANGRLSRTLVNRIWTRLMGRGLVEPNDEMDNRPWHPDLLDWLAVDFAENGYDVKKLIERIVTSRAYQLPSVPLKSERVTEYVFAGPVVKRLSAEQFVDAVSSLTGVWQPVFRLPTRRGMPLLPAGAAVKFRSRVLRSGSVEIDVDLRGAKTLVLIATDGGDGASHDWVDWADARLEGPEGGWPTGPATGPAPRVPTPATGPIGRAPAPPLVRGAGWGAPLRGGRGERYLSDLAWHSASAGYGQVRKDQNIVEKPLRLGDRTFARGLGTHAESVIAYVLPRGATRFRATAGPDAGAVEEPGARPSVDLFVVTGDLSLLEPRAAMAVADSLTRALGRPNREQVVTQRATVATTLQALELTNGQILATMLKKGAERWTSRPHPATATLVASIYRQALGRPPTPAERQIAVATIGTPARNDGVEDLLWALVMLPEFQLVY